ncbi:molybdopterin molybdotransferase MoeA [Cryptosporangium aurantiacum]|uniref:Molybdopterin molybdenumtransferase n=1 Tax=Cryptosporangium aurantiacum TaxID=134849 RepID=A0A1M7MI80_9ACTN|nr:molybdopterin molybdotransferase MoeA [Cryptosporangium aurantiacum]SHM90119.1 molybdopterin molybdotransferase [Cryptosporangium aurantiacum]
MTLASWREARALARTLAGPVGVDTVPLALGAGRVLAADVCSRTLVPGFDTAAMDGYAVAGAGPWRVTGRVLAGATNPGVVTPGTAVEIATGAPVPDGAEAVVPYEDVRVDGGLVDAPPPRKAHIRRAGEDLRPGDVLATAGRDVTPPLLGLLAQGGTDSLPVRRRPAVRLVVTGDEVVDVGLPGAGQVRDALGPLVVALTEQAGASTPELVPVPDDRDRLRAAVAAAGPDVVVVTGSSSVGRADHLHAVLADLGATLHVDGVACRPGHPQLLAGLPDGGWVIGLPGNPFAGLVGCLTLLRPLLDGLLGRAEAPAVRFPLRGGSPPPGTVTRLLPVRVRDGAAVPVSDAGPARLRAAADADGVAVLEPGWEPDQPVEFLRF